MNKLFIIFFFIAAFCGFSQNKTIDSLKRTLKVKDLHDTIKINNSLSIAKNYLSIDLDSFYLYTEKSLEKSLSNDNFKLPRVYNNKGLYHIYKSNPDSAHYYFDLGLLELEKADNKIERATIYANYSMSYQNSDDFDKKIDYNLKAIDLLSDDQYEVSRLHFNQAIIYGQADLIEQSKKHLKLAYNYSHETNYYLVEGAALKGLAHYAIEEKKIDSARVYLEQGLKICNKTNSPQICYEITSKLGELYDDLEHYNEANKLLLRAKEYALKRKQPYNILASNIFLGQHESKKKNYAKSVEYFKVFDSLYELNEIPELGQVAYKSWAEVEAKRGQYEKSNQLTQKYILIKDSIFSKENRAVLADANAKYETEKKDKEILAQQLALEKSESETQILSVVIFSLLLASILIWFLFQQRQKRKNQEILTLKREHQIKTLETLIEGEENERLRIAKELHDGVNGDLSAIKYKLTSLLELNNTVIDEALSMIDKSCKQVRAISHNLIPPSLESFNVVEAVKTFCENSNAIHKTEIQFHHIGQYFEINKKDEVNIFRIIQELVTNSIKHSTSSEINVQMSHRDHVLHITVEDNGKGFDKTKETEGIGLKNIASRVDYLNAELDVVSNEKGTSFTVEIDKNKRNDH